MMFKVWENLSDLKMIKSLKLQTSNEDGETSTVEFKGSTDGFSKASKANLAKEISAMANTYGGLLVFHATNLNDADDIIGFGGTACPREKSLESWFSDATEPPIRGMQLKEVDGVFLIYVPESEAKPHRCRHDKNYYYRSNSLSQPMPEIMVSALYRTGSKLSITSHVQLVKEQSKQLSFYTRVQNTSRAVGTKPRFTLSLWGNKTANSLMAAKGSVMTYGGTCLGFPNDKSEINFLGVFATQPTYRDEVLYPEDNLNFYEYFTLPPAVVDKFWENEVILTSFKVNFVEIPEVTRWDVFQISSDKLVSSNLGGSYEVAIENYKHCCALLSAS